MLNKRVGDVLVMHLMCFVFIVKSCISHRFLVISITAWIVIYRLFFLIRAHQWLSVFLFPFLRLLFAIFFFFLSHFKQLNVTAFFICLTNFGSNFLCSKKVRETQCCRVFRQPARLNSSFVLRQSLSSISLFILEFLLYQVFFVRRVFNFELFIQ